MSKKQPTVRAEEISEKTPLERLVALTFDDHPEVRLKAGQILEKIDDPKALFALIELSSDKEASVRNFAEEALRKKTTDETYTSLEKLFAPRPKGARAEGTAESQSATESEAKGEEWGLAPIEEFFESLEEKKVRSAREKLLPSLEKLFGKAEDERTRRIKEMLMSSLEKYFSKREVLKAPEKPKKKIMREKTEEEKEKESAVSQIEEIKAQVSLPELEEEEEMEEFPEFLRESEIYKKAYALASTPGITKKAIKREEKRLIDNYKKEVQLAFKIAILRAAGKGGEVERISSLEEGMKSICTRELEVGALEEKEVKLGKKVERLMRLLLKDGSGEIALYIPPERGKGISIGDRIKLEGVKVRSISGEKALSLLAKGKILVVK